MLLYGWNQHNIVTILQLKINLRKETAAETVKKKKKEKKKKQGWALNANIFHGAFSSPNETLLDVTH